MDIVKVNHEEFGLEEVKAREISNLFKPMLDKMVELEKEYNEVINMELCPETYKKARELRLRYVKVRTGTDKIHKNAKAHYRKVGLFIDSWKNAQLLTSEGNEAKLFEIENHKAIELKKQIAKLQEERLERIREFEPDFDEQVNLGEMSEIFWATFIAGIEARYNKRIEDEKSAEKERKRKFKETQLHEERRQLIVGYWKYIADDRKKDNFGTYSTKKWNELLNNLKEQYDIDKLHEERKKELLSYWIYMDKDLQEQNFGLWEEKTFKGLLAALIEKDEKFQTQRAKDRIKAEKAEKAEGQRRKEKERRIKAERTQKMLELGFKQENDIFTYYNLSIKKDNLIAMSEANYKNNISIIKRKIEKIDAQNQIENSKTGIELISQERQEQLEKHQRTIRDDYKYNNDGELITGVEALLIDSPSWADFPDHWNKKNVEHMISKPYIDRLVIAGALIAAEIDRLNYEANQNKKES